MNNYYTSDQLNKMFEILDGSIYSEYTIDGWVKRLNRFIIMHMNISPGFCNIAQWWTVGTLSDGTKPNKSFLCNCNGYQGGWSDPTPVAAMIDTYGKIMIYSQNNKLTNFTISAVWYTNQ